MLKYEKFIEIGDSPTTLLPFYTPSNLTNSLNDVDKDPFTDLEGYTHRNKVREDVLSLDLSYNYLTEEDLSNLLKKISPVWFYVKLTDRKTKTKNVYKMYASTKKFDTWKIVKQADGTFKEEFVAFSVSFVEE